MEDQTNEGEELDGQLPQWAALRTLLLTGVVAAAIASLYFWQLQGRAPAGGDHPALWPVVALGIWAANAQPVASGVNRPSVSMALSEIPGLIGIAFLAPGPALLAVSVGHLAAGAQRRSRLLVGLADWVAYGAGTGAGLLTYDKVVNGWSPAGGRGWAAAAIALAVISVVDLSLLAVFGFAPRRGTRPAQRGRPLWPSVVAIAVSTLGALVAVSVVWVSTWASLLLVALLGASQFAYRRTVVAGLRYKNLERLYELTRTLASLTEAPQIVTAVLLQVRAVLRADWAELVLPTGHAASGGERTMLRFRLAMGQPLAVEKNSPVTGLDELACRAGAAVLAAGTKGGQSAEAEMARLGLKAALVAPLQRDEPAEGYLLVADRGSHRDSFRGADLGFFEAVAANAGVALRSTKLLGQLRHEARVRQFEAQHDALTGLPNRVLFHQRLDEALDHLPGAGRLAVMLVDLDRFKEVNDTLGHDTGDAVLCQVAQRLASLNQEGNLVARLGGDEFAVLMLDAPGDEVIAARAGELINAISGPLGIEGLVLDVRASVGIAVASQRGDAETVMRHADVAMYTAKRSGGGARFYDRTADRSTLRRLRLATELRRAIERADLDLWYQPVIQIRTGTVLSCEALLRWEHDQFGPISPAEFIPVAEDADLIDQLTWWVLGTALDQAKRWRQLVPGLGMAVNISARSLMNMEFANHLADALEHSGLQAGVLTLELAESSAMADPQSSERVLHALDSLGVNLSIDDYGTGFSSLSRLKRLPFRELKIDRSFVKGMSRNTADEAIVRSTIELARSLGRTVTAEGVEDEATLGHLGSLGCDAAQGFLLARPLPARHCETWLAAAKITPGGVLRAQRLGEQDSGEAPR